MRKGIIGCLVGLTALLIAVPSFSQNTCSVTNQDNVSVNPDDSPEAQQLQACLPPGAVVVRCGCWGYVNFGEVLPASACCSGFAMAFACNAYCPGGGVAWFNRCTD